MSDDCESDGETSLNDYLTDIGANHSCGCQLQHLIVVAGHAGHDGAVGDVYDRIYHAQHGIADGSIDNLHARGPGSCLGKHQQAGGNRQGNTAVKEISTILAQLGIAIIDVTPDYRTPKTVDEPDRENQSADEGRINLQYRSEIEHQVTSNRLEDEILG